MCPACKQATRELRYEMQHNKHIDLSPNSSISTDVNPGFYVYVWPLRARHSLGTAQVMCSVMQNLRHMSVRFTSNCYPLWQ